jgi:hypothetical protein
MADKSSEFPGLALLDETTPARAGIGSHERVMADTTVYRGRSVRTIRILACLISLGALSGCYYYAPPYGYGGYYGRPYDGYGGSGYNQPGYGSGYGSQPGYSGGYANQPGYGTQPGYGNPPGYGDYGAQPGYGSPPGYGGGYGAQPGYGGGYHTLPELPYYGEEGG